MHPRHSTPSDASGSSNSSSFSSSSDSPDSIGALRRRTLLGALGAVAVTGALSHPATAAGSATTGSARSATSASAAYVLRSRQAWGADESLRFGPDGRETWPADYHPVQTLSVHHTGSANGEADPAARVRTIYRDQTVGQGWGDIGYHYLIDAAGLVYEGRWSGSDGDPAHDAAGRLVTAAHIVTYNTGNVGIALLGTFTTSAPTSAARGALVQLLAELATRHAIDPLQENVAYVNPVNGAVWNGPAISGHRDWAATACPGGVLHSQLPAIRADVAALTG
ncbi:peptidoglycan recognition protein family protein [Streptomyces sp. SP18BB07]|uniref:peptidoglycan recognition protein family protein n=1 Tax=Streptomyces sp. SP18BB07 TaxID=3002522 RepID=UPI002E78D2FF|nr:peptidoglycan recognition family protein [Streptomyces sp. SP18BB07]MEE1762176.1 peptidoglycan recognition family protein [Streptomyces sp. SP18BB07]